MVRKVMSTTAFSLCLAGLLAQTAPRETVSVDLGGMSIAINYGRPSLQGRDFYDLLSQLPPERMWRAGSDQVTTLISETAFRVGDTLVPPGRYSVYLHCPDGGPYSLVLNSVVGQPLKNVWSAAPAHLADEPFPHFQYESEIADHEVARVPMRQESGGEPVDRFTVSLNPAGNGAVLRIAWGTESWSLNLMRAPREGSRVTPKRGRGATAANPRHASLPVECWSRPKVIVCPSRTGVRLLVPLGGSDPA